MLKPDVIRSALYTRQQVAKLTGLDDSTLNYWMREGVLRPSEGGGGKGQHRRFPYHQINLAVLLNELRTFGISLPALRRLSDRFHSAVAFMDGIGITRDNSEWFGELMGLRRSMARHGFIKQSVREEHVAKLVEICSWFGTRMISRTHQHLAFEFQVSFEEELDLRSKWHLVYDREPHEEDRYPSHLVDLSSTVDPDEYAKANRYWSPITYIDPDISRHSSSAHFHYFHRNDDGAWELLPGDPDDVTSYVGIFLDALTSKAWSAA